jgi:serine/threonine protein kinase/Flp pilus assembly protein TadD
MDPERWRQVEQLYLAALDKKPDERAAFLGQACAGDTSLREEVASLLSFAPDADSVLQAAVQEVASQASGVTATMSGRFGTTTAGASQKLGRYELLEKIGKGGMGVVYRALDPAIGRIVAIKTILTKDGDEDDSQLRARLLRESQAGGRLSHPNIVAVHDVCDDGQTAYIVMEYVQGRTLDKVMREDATLQSSGEALRIVQECAAALDYAHSRGVVHRDVKPTNIMLQADGMVKIADFGIAKVAQSTALTQGAVAVGSPHYMAPEQWRGEAVTGQADQYALATVAYALLAGRRPFEGDSVASLAAMTLYQEPPAAITFNARLNPMVDVVLRKALSKAGESRYANCQEFALALRKAWDNVPAPEPPSRAPRAVNKQKWMIAAFAMALLAILAVAGGVFYQSKIHREAAGNPKAPLEVAKTVSPPVTTAEPPAPTAIQPASQPAQPKASDVKPPRKASRPVAQPPEDPQPQPGAELQAEKLMKQGDYARAAIYFTQAIAAKPDFRTYFERATAYRQLGQMEKAISDYSQAISLKQDSPVAYHDRALCEMRLGLEQRAADDYDQALKIDPARPRSWNGRGVIYLKRGGYKKAKDYFTKAIELNQNFSEAYQNRAKAEMKLNETAAAEADLKKAKTLVDQKISP